MDDRTWHLAVGALAASAAALVLDAVLASFEVPGGFWAVPPAVLTFLAARSRLKDGDDA